MFEIVWILVVLGGVTPASPTGWSLEIATLKSKKDCRNAILELQEIPSATWDKYNGILGQSVEYVCTPKPIYK